MWIGERMCNGLMVVFELFSFSSKLVTHEGHGNKPPSRAVGDRKTI